jgi:hypothetical protein
MIYSIYKKYKLYKKSQTGIRSAPAGSAGVVMFTNKTKVLLLLQQDVLDRARVLAGKATIGLKLPVSLQIVLRALIEEGLKRDNHAAVLANVEGQAKAVRHHRSMAGRAGLRGIDPRGAGS